MASVPPTFAQHRDMLTAVYGNAPAEEERAFFGQRGTFIVRSYPVPSSERWYAVSELPVAAGRVVVVNTRTLAPMTKTSAKDCTSVTLLCSRPAAELPPLAYVRPDLAGVQWSACAQDADGTERIVELVGLEFCVPRLTLLDLAAVLRAENRTPTGRPILPPQLLLRLLQSGLTPADWDALGDAAQCVRDLGPFGLNRAELHAQRVRALQASAYGGACLLLVSVVEHLRTQLLDAGL